MAFAFLFYFASWAMETMSWSMDIASFSILDARNRVLEDGMNVLEVEIGSWGTEKASSLMAIKLLYQPSRFERCKRRFGEWNSCLGAETLALR